MRIAALAIYPLKGAAAVALDAVEIDALGPVGDRRYCLARPGGRVFTQRDDASLARLRATLQGEGLSLSYDGEQVDVPPEAFGAVLGDEPLRTLSRLRLRDGEAVFGVRYSVVRPGRVRLGDRVELSDQ